MKRNHGGFYLVGIACAGLAGWMAPAYAGLEQVNLVSDGFVPAANIDPNLINPWGISFGPTTPFWVSDNGSGLAALYTAAGKPVSPLMPPSAT